MGFFSTTPGRCTKNVQFVLQQGMKAEGESRGIKADSHIACRAAEGLECVFPI